MAELLSREERRRRANAAGQEAMRNWTGRSGYSMGVMPVANAAADLWHDEVAALHEEMANIIEGRLLADQAALVRLGDELAHWLREAVGADPTAHYSLSALQRWQALVRGLR